MSDDLVKRLRDWEHVHPEDYCKDAGHLYEEAADRIEELEAKLQEQIEWVKSLADDLIAAEGREARLKEKLATCEKYRDAYAECDKIGTKAVRDLEAKLAKVVEGERERCAKIADKCQRENGHLSKKGFNEQYRRGLEAAGQAIAAAIRAEPTGGKDE